MQPSVVWAHLIVFLLNIALTVAQMNSVELYTVCSSLGFYPVCYPY